MTNYFAQGQQIKARLEQRLSELRKEANEIESALTKFEAGPRLLPPIPKPSRPSNDTDPPAASENEGKRSVVAELTELRPFWDHLAPRPREIVGLRASGMKPAEIAEKLKTNKGRVSTCIFLAKKTLVAARERSSKPAKPPKQTNDPDEPAHAGPRRKKTTKTDRTDNTILGSYMKEAGRYPLMSREEEHNVAARFVATGDPKLEAALVTANLRLVVKIAHDYRKTHRNLNDLVQEGNIGLMHAVRKFDPSRGFKLSTYASWWIKAYILKFIIANWRLVKIGTTQSQRKLFFNLRKERAKLEKDGLPGFAS